MRTASRASLQRQPAHSGRQTSLRGGRVGFGLGASKLEEGRRGANSFGGQQRLLIPGWTQESCGKGVSDEKSLRMVASGVSFRQRRRKKSYEEKVALPGFEARRGCFRDSCVTREPSFLQTLRKSRAGKGRQQALSFEES